MKVFISWSGTKSHKVAMVFRDWLPSVIQSLVPYVSSEDIDKGARWSTDIATELEDSSFGIVCVTKDNINAPWISFEAGALSKAMDKSFVTPFLFDIKRSEVNGPILQFQSTVFEREDIKKLVITLNKACDKNGIAESRLDDAFDVWYPRLEAELKKISNSKEEKESVKQKSAEAQDSAIMEELLTLSRDNIKLLRYSDNRMNNSIDELSNKVNEIHSNVMRTARMDSKNKSLESIFYRSKFDFIFNNGIAEKMPQYAFLILINVLEDDFPWIYFSGRGLIDLINSKMARTKKIEAVNEYQELIRLTVRGLNDSYVEEYLHRVFRYSDKLLGDKPAK